ncbi:hypothetical protein A2774_04125 [Candidatus Roizmanbacteria bacterium RIFCSPHIGHO2_01_FULL_39_12c]|uniref:O-antigen ligase-related domain-containing protein n=1 Tax=Candidatus Roizmanbacteria bacterium RIFCSPHIGHO2_01_FULL_39_12c TaxID=1802031 RepID=A0A1F7GEM4_9BACT|nr:MAG: hypothetical protein A2774_04125 [Candidatus Roizmanbacteria bacterium RIFCSPHIGHO2_01_FULL_39_12c]OGK48083.1 MAG: hypothetical protein A2963_03940 [Candidatus Roizmanbacteria bacterium RIFCSPLOWO2_01_FULL_40_13]
MNLLLYLTIFLFSLGQIGRISFFGQQINLYLYEILVLSGLMVLLGKYRLKPLTDSFKEYRLAYIFFIWLALSFLIGISQYKAIENFVGFLYLVRIVLYWTYGIFLRRWIDGNFASGKILDNSMRLLIILVILFSAVQYLFYPNLRNLIYAGWDPHLYRMFGTFFDTSVAGAVYGLILMRLFFTGDGISKNKFIKKALMIVFLVFIVLTYSRILYLSLTIAAGFFAVRKKRFKAILVFIFLFGALILLSPKPFGEGVNLMRTFSIRSRVADYQNALKIWEKNPIFGIGYNRLRYAKVKLNLIEEAGSELTHSGASFHSSFLIILATSGTAGLVFFISLLVGLARLHQPARYPLMFLSLLSLGDNVLLHPFVLFLLVTILATPFRK